MQHLTVRLGLLVILLVIGTVAPMFGSKPTGEGVLALKGTNRSGFQTSQISQQTSLVVSSSASPGFEREQVRAMDLLEDGFGWVLIGRHLLRTNSGGKQWSEITPTHEEPFTIESVFFLDTSTGWALISSSSPDGDSVSLKLASTIDAGKTWSVGLLSAPNELSTSYAGFANIDFIDPLHGWIMLRLSSSANFSRGILLTTSDGGKSWSQLSEPPLGEPVEFVNEREGWLAGGPNGDELYRTRNGGNSWSRITVSGPASIHKTSDRKYELPSFENNQDGVLPVSFVGPHGLIKVFYRTSDAGDSWEPSTMSTLAPRDAHLLSSVVNSRFVVVVPSNKSEIGILQNGKKARSRSLVGILGDDLPLTKLDFTTEAQGWLLATVGRCKGHKSDCKQETKLFSTLDGGQSLTEITPDIAAPASRNNPDTAPLAVGKGRFEEIVPDSASISIQNKEGFDKCAVASEAQMQNWWNSSPYKAAGVYIGGENHSCKTQAISSSWLSNVMSMGWGIIPTWVGPQAPSVSGNCQTTCSKMSTNSSTAEAQGVAEANKAADQATNYGLQGTIIYYDMEAYDSNASGVVVKAFMNGWVRRLKERGFDGAGYGSRLNVSDWANIANPPAAIWFTYFFQNGVPCGNTCHNVFGIPGISDSLWFNHQRIRQTSSGFNQCWSSVCLTIDEDWLDGPVAGVATPPPPPSNTTDGFDYAVGKPNASGYGITGWGFLQWTGSAYHPGEDWNGTGGGDTDLGDPVYATANGTVVAAGNYGAGWGNIILVRHDLPGGGNVWSQYAHLKDILVGSGTVVRGQQIGTIGKGYNNEYLAHLHFEIRKTNLAADAWVSGLSQAQVQDRYHNPSAFINANRPSSCSSPGAFALSGPGNGQTLSSTTSVNLTWGASANANSYEVYFGTSSNPPSLGTQTATNRTVSVTPGQTYYWKVVAKVNCGSATTTAGVWSFTVQQTCNSPGAFSLSAPSNGQNVASTTSVNLTWGNSANANSYDVYFGTSSNPPLLGNQTATNRTVSVAAGQTYFWKVVAKVSCGSGTATAGVWSFSVQPQSGCQSTPIGMGQTVNGSLTSSDCIYPGTSKYYDLYSFHGVAGQQISASMDSTAFDTYLYLTNSANQVLAEDNNSGPGTNSRIVGLSGFFTLPATGTYFLWASSAANSLTGAYTLSLSQCTFSLRSYENTIGPGNGGGSFQMETASGCSWSAVSDSQSWLTTSSSGMGDGSVSYNFNANPSTSPRTGRITVGGQVYAVTQIGIGGGGNVRFSSATYTASEGGGVITVTVTRQGGTYTGTVNYSTANGTATAGVDYTATSGLLLFGENQTSKSFDVPILDDTLFEGNETINLSLGNHSTSFTLGSPSTATLTITDDDSSPTSLVQFSSGGYVVNEGTGFGTVTVTRTGPTSGAASVNYATSDSAGLQSCTLVNAIASERCDYVTSVGTVTFAVGESSKTVSIPVIDDGFVEVNENLSVTLNNAIGTSLGSASANVTIVDNDIVSPTSNPIDGIEFFIRQMYRDILNRQPDSTGLQNWINTLANCPNGGFGEPPTSNCDRLHVAAGFFQSDEFLNRGYWAFRFYMVSFQQRPTYAQFIPDMAQVGGPKSPAEEDAAKAAFAESFVQRSTFTARYGGSSGQALANALTTNAGLPSFTVTGNMTNGQILRAIAERQSTLDRFLVEGTVSILYFGFQRRDPDTIGYQNNLNTLNASPNNLRHMIFIFIYSTEYRQRFGPP